MNLIKGNSQLSTDNAQHAYTGAIGQSSHQMRRQTDSHFRTGGDDLSKQTDVLWSCPSLTIKSVTMSHPDSSVLGFLRIHLVLLLSKTTLGDFRN